MAATGTRRRSRGETSARPGAAVAMAMAAGPPPSRVVREVCLIGRARPAGSWVQDASVEWSGRIYRVAAVQFPERRASTPGRRRGYVHLHLSDDDGRRPTAAAPR